MPTRKIRFAEHIGYRCLICGEEHGKVAPHQPTLLFTNGYPNGLCPMSGRWMGITHEGEPIWSEAIFEYSEGIEEIEPYPKLVTVWEDELERKLQ